MFEKKQKLHLGLLVAVQVDAVVVFHTLHKLLHEKEAKASPWSAGGSASGCRRGLSYTA
jgi:hypothetical protein